MIVRKCLLKNTILFCIYTVQCGPGSYYDEGEARCKLCELNTYSDHSSSSSCTPCPSNTVTLQRGSSSFSDCRGEIQIITTKS